MTEKGRFVSLDGGKVLPLTKRLSVVFFGVARGFP
jgi:hypothetical protein